MPRLFHVSENPHIKEFVPRPSLNANSNLVGEAVWAITDKKLANYMLPRDCPRICYKDEESYVIAIEKGWLPTIKSTTLYLYEFDDIDFEEFDTTAGYYISRKTVKPKLVTPLEGLLEKVAEKGVNVKVLDHLHDEKKKVLENHTDFSIIRFRNAIEPTS